MASKNDIVFLGLWIPLRASWLGSREQLKGHLYFLFNLSNTVELKNHSYLESHLIGLVIKIRVFIEY